MQNDKTIIRFHPTQDGQKLQDQDNKTHFVSDGLQVTVLEADKPVREVCFFLDGFQAGRSQENDIAIPTNNISRHHLQVKRETEGWYLYDLDSTNGIYQEGKRLSRKTRLQLPALLHFGYSSYFLRVEAATPKSPIASAESPLVDKTVIAPVERKIPTTPIMTSTTLGRSTSNRSTKGLSKEELKARLLTNSELQDAGEYTQIVRSLIQEDRAQHRKSYRKIIWSVAVLLLLMISLVIYQQSALSNARSLAMDVFYDMKTLELDLAQSEIRQKRHMDSLKEAMQALQSKKLAIEQAKLEQKLLAQEQAKLEKEQQLFAQKREKLQQMRGKYRQYVKQANTLRLRLPSDTAYEDKLILRVARQFGESELEAPPQFISEVRRYIRYWQSSSRMRNAMQRLERNAYAPIILQALQNQNLPKHFLYLPLQESNYNPKAIGPETRYGIAKGAWQFLATTGQEFGLKSGPLASSRKYDSLDQRFDFKKATQAGAKYLKHIYSTEAQASGLLVMAGYNYGHNRVKGLIRKMPENPRDRNFWKFIQQHKIPQETYDYVFYIVAAAVIGEAPEYFGFKFTSPLLN